MKKMRMCFPKEKTFRDGFQEYILDCKARNLRDGTIHHYQESVKQIYKRIPPNTPCPIRFNGLPVSDERCGQFG